MVFLPGTASDEVVEMYYTAFEEMTARDDFAEMAEATLGVYPQLTRAAGQGAYEAAISVPAEAKQYVLDWLAEDYGVTPE